MDRSRSKIMTEANKEPAKTRLTSSFPCQGPPVGVVGWNPRYRVLCYWSLQDRAPRRETLPPPPAWGRYPQTPPVVGSSGLSLSAQGGGAARGHGLLSECLRLEPGSTCSPTSKLVFLHHSLCSPSCHPWSPQKAMMVSSASPRSSSVERTLGGSPRERRISYLPISKSTWEIEE